MFNIDYKKYSDAFIKENNITSNITYIIDKLSTCDNIAEYLQNEFVKINFSEYIFIVDAVVFNDDAYTNTIYSFICDDFKRIYKPGEILNAATKYSSLEYFIKFKGIVNVENIDNSLIEDMPESLKKDMLIFEYNKLKAVNQNFALYVFKKF